MECVTEISCSGSQAARGHAPEQRETLLLLHGSAGSSKQWRSVRDALATLYRVVAPDLIGYGDAAPWPHDVALTLADEARRIDRLVPCCERRFHVVGYSYGGAVALELARMNPVRIRTLTLVEPVFFAALGHGGEQQAFNAFAEVRGQFVAAMASGNRERAMADFIDFWSGAESWRAMPVHARNAMFSMAPKIQLDWDASFAFDPGAKLLEDLATKTLVVRGARSPEPMVRLVDALHRLMPGSARAVISDANHLLPMTHGGQLAGVLLSHLHAAADRELP